MHLIESKVLYLQNYSKINQRKQALQKNSFTTNLNQSLVQYLKIDNIQRSKARSVDNRYDKNLFQNHQAKIPKLLQPIYRKQQQIIQKITKQQKNKYHSNKCYTVSFKDQVAFEKHPIAQVDSIQVASMKPTDRFFHKMQNLRMAQKLLLAKPTSVISRESQSKFYKQQSIYKSNIRKLSSSIKKDQQLQKKIFLNRNKWKN